MLSMSSGPHMMYDVKHRARTAREAAHAGFPLAWSMASQQGEVKLFL